ncbi:MAG: Crp/Fnr family transcriptional regulator [Hyphomicrobium sp.]|uniref:Crp/Fnr family transcriptional regulator n=1 Tax=Hyphomicrobium sp. TaxID=82 RepID=UPI0039E3FCF0
MLRTGIADYSEGALAVDVAALNPQANNGASRTLAQNELLFEAGDIKSKLYQVESGALCIYRTHPDLRVEIVEHVLAGELVGMGYLERHTDSARATVETKVRCIDLDAVDELIETDPHNRARYHDAIEREFAFRRESLSNASRERPMVRVASFLVAVSNRIGEEGGDPSFVDDTVDCGVIADFLGLSVDLLALALVQLEMRGLVETAPPHGLRLKDIAALEDIAMERDNVPALWARSSEEELRAALQ